MIQRPKSSKTSKPIARPEGRRSGFFPELLGILLSAALIVPALALEGCFRVGMPEYFSGSTAGAVNSAAGGGLYGRALLGSHVQKPLAILLRPADSTEPDASLGHQYLLGIFPFTSVYFQHGVQSLVDEVSSSVLADEGYEVASIDSSNVALLNALNPSIAVEPKISGLRINGFDAIFFRLLDIDGVFELSFRSAMNGSEIKLSKQSIGESRYRRFAHAPLLANLVQTKIKGALVDSLRNAPPRREGRLLAAQAGETAAGTASTAPVVLAFPSLLNPPATGIGLNLAASYGYDSVSAFSAQSILRIVQRGAEETLRAEHIAAVSLRSPELVPRSIAAGLDDPMIINLAVERLANTEPEGSTLLLATRIETLNSAGLRITHCTATVPEVKHVDGAQVMTLEKAARLSLSSALPLTRFARSLRQAPGTQGQVGQVEDAEPGEVTCRTE